MHSLIKIGVLLAFPSTVGFFIFFALEAWFTENPWEVRKLTLDLLFKLPKEMTRWILFNTKNIDQLYHYLITAASCIASTIIFFFEAMLSIPLAKNRTIS
ncbi:hypothetical protein [Serratia rhizosphaerae]